MLWSSANNLSLKRLRHALRRLGAFRLGLLAFSLAVSALYVSRARDLPANYQPDSYYYFGVARHIALTGRLEEPIVWTFLAPPAAANHAPFDYWGPLTSLLLVPSLGAFGASFHVATVTMAVVSALGLLAFWYLVSVALPIRSKLIQLFALALFAWSPCMVVLRFDTESIAVHQLWLVLALIALARRRYAMAAVMALLLVATRAEGVVLGGLVWLSCLWLARGSRGKTLLAMAASATAYVSWSLASFGSPVPPAARAASFLTHQDDLYAFGRRFDGSFARLLADHLHAAYLKDRVVAAFAGMADAQWVAGHSVWMGVGLLGGILFFLRRRALPACLWLLLFGGGTLLAWASPVATFMPWRAYSAFLPLAVAVGALGADAVLTEARRLSRLALPLLLSAALAWATVARIEVYDGFPATHNADPEIRALDHRFGEDVVLTTRPWHVMALTHASTVMFPHDGDASVEAALRKYRARWVLVDGQAALHGGASSPLLTGLYQGSRARIGKVKLERVPTMNVKVVLYRVVE